MNTPPPPDVDRHLVPVVDTDQGESPFGWSDPAPDENGPTVSSEPTPAATGPEAARRVHFTDPRITALALAGHAAARDDDREWHHLDVHQQHAWRTAARDWLRAAVTLGLLPRVVPSTGDALATVPLDVNPLTGRPRPADNPPDRDAR